MRDFVYILSGLGADERVFQNISFPSHIQPHFIHWIEPNKKESIQDYGCRLSEQIKTKNPILIGLSFGGMVAVEIAKQINCKQLIFISSAKTSNELPFYYKLIGKLGLHRLIPAKLMKHSNFLTQWFFGTQSKENALLKQILKDTDSTFLNWAINQILHWKNEKTPPNCFHIHGKND